MDKRFYFERNLLALSQKDPALCSRLSGAVTTLGRYRFLDSRTGESVPALVDAGGTAHPLHSVVDPRREGTRLIAALGDVGFLIFFGLGGGYHIAAALERQEIHRILVIDYDINGIAELLASRDYIHIFNDPRVQLLIDPSPELLKQLILTTFQPALYGGIRVSPLRTRTEQDQDRFNHAGEAVKLAISSLSTDYSVQAFFGTRWFSNIIRNLFRAAEQTRPLPPVRRAAICAAGPSLDLQLPLLGKDRSSRYIIATDTSLGSLLRGGIEPDAVVSIDCQHISYYHFMAGYPRHIPLFLDLASPPLLTSLPAELRFFSGGHPLTRYIARYWRPLPLLDTSGANVTYAALSLAEHLGAECIELYGADFSYPLGRTYARGAYIYPYFEVRQNRLNTLEARHSAFLYRSSSLIRRQRESPPDRELWYYETPQMTRYREGIETKARSLEGILIPIPGLGAPIELPGKPHPPQGAGIDCGVNPSGGKAAEPIRLFSAGRMLMGAGDFLTAYRRKVRELPRIEQSVSAYLQGLSGEEGLLLSTLLPGAAALKRRTPGLEGRDLLEAVRNYALEELDRVISRAGYHARAAYPTKESGTSSPPP
ncbi:MAG: DUF115 domain-containing protein [Spirochaetaceae bacterium]|jgi:hypothetical protein|nr:DUF115 domain-containing protein [Spirochaetaceae bacterium]